MKVDQQEFVNAYIERQQRAIADLTHKVVMLETQLMLAQKRIQQLTPPEETKADDGFESGSIQKQEE
jgi:methylphosphotriester-DNA--protein-cysteine methyltransferase